MSVFLFRWSFVPCRGPLSLCSSGADMVKVSRHHLLSLVGRCLWRSNVSVPQRSVEEMLCLYRASGHGPDGRDRSDWSIWLLYRGAERSMAGELPFVLESNVNWRSGDYGVPLVNGEQALLVFFWV